MYRPNSMIAVAVAAFFSASTSAALAAGAAQPGSPVAVPPAFLEARGAIVQKMETVAGGMHAFTFEKDGKQGVVYTTPDNSAAFFGVMFDAKTGENLSDRLMPTKDKLLQPQPTALNAPLPSPMDKSEKEIAEVGASSVLEHVKAVDKDMVSIADHIRSDKVPGVTEGGSADSAKTTFVFFDPLCSYCHTLYKQTRESVKAGKTIKWIPVDVVEGTGMSLPLSKAILETGVKGLDAMSKNRLQGQQVNTYDRAKISNNTAFFYAMLQKMNVRAATPTILFLNEKTGKLVVAQQDGTDPKFLKAAFGTDK